MRFRNSLDGWKIRTGYPKLVCKKEVGETLPRWYKLYGYTSLKHKEIVIHPHYVKMMEANELNNLLRHEIAHALSGEGHTKKWKYYCRRLGCPTTNYTIIKEVIRKRYQK